MSGTDEDSSTNLKKALSAFLRERPLDEDLARRVREDAADETVSRDVVERARAALARGLFDGSVARARASMGGTLGTFGTALRRIRTHSSRSVEEMASQASVSTRLWTELETQRIPLGTVDVSHLASIVEVVQLGLSDLRATIRRSMRMSVVSVQQTSFRADDAGDADTAAAFEDLVDAAAARTGRAGAHDQTDEVDELVDRIAEELRRRGRADLLQTTQ